MGKSTQDLLVCDYCGQEQKEIRFLIGAAGPKGPGKEFTMHEGTGKVSCPGCYEQGKAEGIERIDKHVEFVHQQHLAAIVEQGAGAGS